MNYKFISPPFVHELPVNIISSNEQVYAFPVAIHNYAISVTYIRSLLLWLYIRFGFIVTMLGEY